MDPVAAIIIERLLNEIRSLHEQIDRNHENHRAEIELIREDHRAEIERIHEDHIADINGIHEDHITDTERRPIEFDNAEKWALNFAILVNEYYHQVSERSPLQHPADRRCAAIGSEELIRVDSDAAYLVAPEARSRAGGYQYLSNKEGTLFNGPVLVIAKVIKNVMVSATEAELAAVFMNTQEAVALRNCLEAMGYPQPATPVKTDNSAANGIINNTMKQKRSKAIDVRFYWVRDRVKQGQFEVFWDSGKNNLGDYHTKKHPPAYYKKNLPIQTFVEGLSPESLQGCIRMMNSDLRK